MISLNIMALDRDFNLVALLRYTNLQWSRMYHECGTFSIQIPLEQYNSSFKYIYTKDRPETGKITQVNYVSNQGQQFIQLSGYFMENELNRMVVYAKGEGNIIGNPTWAEKTGVAEDVAYDFFNTFSQIQYYGGSMEEVTYRLGVAGGVNQHRGSYVQHARDNSYLGNKIYHILKSSGMSYRVMYNFEDDDKYFEVWAGKDRTSEQTENNPVIFSTQYGNIKNPNVLIDNSTYKSGCIVVNSKNNNNDSGEGGSSTYVRALMDFDEFQEDNAFLSYQSSINVDDFENLEDYFRTLDSEGRSEKDSKWVRTMNVEFNALVGSYEYMQDFDLGDVCNIEINEVGISADARLIGCYEVVKNNSWSLTLEFGTPIIKR